MRTIICKKCGAEIDAALGECPNCGAVYYILSDEDKKLEWAMSADIDDTQVFKNNESNQTHGATAHDTRDIINADNDELFNTRVWKITDEQEPQKPARTQRAESPATPVRRPVQQRPVQQRPVQQNEKVKLAREMAGKNQPKDKEKDLRKKQLAVAAVALVAVLTLVLSFMGGLFDFASSGDGKDKMPNVVDLTQEAATTILTDLGLEVVPMTEANEAVAGTVIKQSIKKGKKIKEGDKVTITVSSGPSEETNQGTEYVDVPTLTGKTFEEAKQLLTSLGLAITRAEDKYSEEEIGKVISQSPMKGAKLQKGDLVTVTVSKGPEAEEYTITVTAGKGGSISPKGAVAVTDGEDQTFTITADEGYEIREVKVDGTDVGPVTSYTFTNVTEDHTIYVVFKQKTAASPSPSVSPTPSSTPTPTPSKPSSGTDIIG